jgi:DNA-binding MarR family transcriptional regulator
VDADWIRTIIEARQQRQQVFGRDLILDPWDFLLSLYADHLKQEHCTIADVCRIPTIAYTTALRWVAELEKAGLLVRSDDQNDRPLVLVELSALGVEAMRRYFGADARPGQGL